MQTPLIRFGLIFVLSICSLHAADTERIIIDARFLAKLPEKRQAALVLFAITDRDSTPAIFAKRAKYIEALKSMIQELRDNYYWKDPEFPEETDEAIEKRAKFLAGLRYPSSALGASGYSAFFQDYTIQMYEEEITIAAAAICERAKDVDVTVKEGKIPAYADWKKTWDGATKVQEEHALITDMPTTTMPTATQLPAKP